MLEFIFKFVLLSKISSITFNFGGGLFIAVFNLNLFFDFDRALNM